jgi:hypothetical protein
MGKKAKGGGDRGKRSEGKRRGKTKNVRSEHLSASRQHVGPLRPPQHTFLPLRHLKYPLSCRFELNKVATTQTRFLQI